MTKMYIHRFRCSVCGCKFSKKRKTRAGGTPKCPEKSCPSHDAERTRPQFDPTAGRAPGKIGGSNVVKAIDATAEMVMEDYGLTDLRTDVREGETMAPKLPPRLQSMADGFFAGGRGGNGKKLPINTAKIARQVNSGSLRQERFGAPNAVGMMHERREKPPVRIVAGDGVTK